MPSHLPPQPRLSGGALEGAPPSLQGSTGSWRPAWWQRGGGLSKGLSDNTALLPLPFSETQRKLACLDMKGCQAWREAGVCEAAGLEPGGAPLAGISFGVQGDVGAAGTREPPPCWPATIATGSKGERCRDGAPLHAHQRCAVARQQAGPARAPDLAARTEKVCQWGEVAGGLRTRDARAASQGPPALRQHQLPCSPISAIWLHLLLKAASGSRAGSSPLVLSAGSSPQPNLGGSAPLPLPGWLAAPHPRHTCALLAAMEVPGEEFYYARVRKAQQMPAQQRSPDVAAFLEAHQLLEEEAAALGLLGASSSSSASGSARGSSSASRGPALARSEAEQLEAVLVLLVGTYFVPPRPLQHPAFVELQRRDPFVALARPLLEIVPETAMGRITPLLYRLMKAGAPPGHDWQLLARLLLVQFMFNRGKPCAEGITLVHAVTQAVIGGLLDEGAARAIVRQLRQAQQGSRWGARLPSVEDLRITVLMMACGTSLAELRSSPAGQGGSQQQREALARQLMREHPSHPRSHLMLAIATLGVSGLSSPLTLDAERPGLVAQHFRRGLALAMEQGSDVWRAVLAYQLATFGMTHCTAAVMPAEVEEMWRKGRAARQQCKACEPQAWIDDVNDMHQYMKSMQPVLDEHLRLSPQRWGRAGLATMRRDSVDAALSQVVARLNEDDYRKCDGCGSGPWPSSAAPPASKPSTAGGSKRRPTWSRGSLVARVVKSTGHALTVCSTPIYPYLLYQCCSSSAHPFAPPPPPPRLPGGALEGAPPSLHGGTGGWRPAGWQHDGGELRKD